MKLTTIILAVVSCALSVALIAMHYTRGSELRTTRAAYAHISNEWDQVRLKLEESGKLAEMLQQDVATRTVTMSALSNDLTTLRIELGQANADLASAKTEMAQRDARIAELGKQMAQLETQRDDLSKRMEELNSSINTLDAQIAETKKKLDLAEGDRSYLLAELKRLQDEKGGLVAQFNNLAALRTQIAKLKEEAAIKQRLEWMRSGVYARQDQKGAERLFARSQEVLAAPNNRLNIELERSGAGRVTVPGSSGSSSSTP